MSRSVYHDRSSAVLFLRRWRCVSRFSRTRKLQHKGILENRDDVAVADRHPVEAGHATFVGGPREVDLIGFHREQHLARASELAETVKMSRITSWSRRSGSRPSPASRCQM